MFYKEKIFYINDIKHKITISSIYEMHCLISYINLVVTLQEDIYRHYLHDFSDLIFSIQIIDSEFEDLVIIIDDLKQINQKMIDIIKTKACDCISFEFDSFYKIIINKGINT